ncbi:MAG: valine--tRNA ligase [Bacteroidia bacterium]|nr:valine--tRNA ligase [Bacteroidia bacterium]
MQKVTQNKNDFSLSTIEEKWYSYWLEHKYFESKPDSRPPYTIVIPPPNVTGILHMGHMLNNTIQDVFIRRARKMGYNACWVPGTDHASIATEAKVVQMLKTKGIDKKSLSRDEFLKHAWAWKEKYGGIILEQLKKLGASCDWSRTKFTMDPEMSDAVLDAFIHLYNKGYIYRGTRMVNWDPVGKTALSDEEVIYKETDSQLVYINYPLEDNSGHITIATTRPETIMADTAVCVHPDDERYKSLIGKKCLIPLINKAIPIIADTYIDMEFGTGALKVTPAHDINDYEIGIRHGLPVVDGLTDDGKISADARIYVGMDRFECRKQIIRDLKEKGYCTKIETIRNKVGHSERTDAVVEPRISMQWFVKMKELCKPALENVLNGNIELVPSKFINTYRHWMENVKDWCISRQLWWGQRIPAWYDEKGNVAVCKTKEEALEIFKSKYGEVDPSKVVQDEDVLDTWFSSWLWPLTVFDADIIRKGKGRGNKDLSYYYPTQTLVTAPEILFFWVARMIIAGYEFYGEKPFSKVYLTGTVRDKLGRKMSKSLGNSPDPIELMKQYGADGVRMGMLLCSPAGNDLLFDESYCEQGRNFINKIRNAWKLVQMWEVSDTEPTDAQIVCMEWFEEKFNQALKEIDRLFDEFRLNETLMAIYKLIWDDFCSWYLEGIKPEFKDGKALPISKKVLENTLKYFENCLQVLHPFMPFITEEIHQQIRTRKPGEACIVFPWPRPKTESRDGIIQKFELTKELIAGLRQEKAKLKLKPRDMVNYAIPENAVDKFYFSLVEKLAQAFLMEHQGMKRSQRFLCTTVPVDVEIPEGAGKDAAEMKENILKELKYYEGFLESVRKKLSNEKFLQNAKKELVENERKKEADALEKIKILKEQLEKC